MVRTMDWFSVAGAMGMAALGVRLRLIPGAGRYYPLSHAAQGLAVGTLAFAASKATGLNIEAPPYQG